MSIIKKPKPNDNSVPMNSEAGDGHGFALNGPPIPFVQLIKVNESLEHLVTCTSGNQFAPFPLLAYVCREVIENCDPALFKKLRESKSEDCIISSLWSEVAKVIKAPSIASKRMFDGLPEPNEKYFTLIVELLVAAFLYDDESFERKRSRSPSPWRDWRAAVAEATFAVIRKTDRTNEAKREELNAELQEMLDRRQAEHASVDRDQEEEVNLAPAQKARVLRNAILERNNVGHLKTYDVYDGDFLDNIKYDFDPDILFFKADLNTAEDFFDQHRTLSVSHVLMVLEQCLEVHRTTEKPRGFDPHFHIREGRRVAFLLKHIDRIVGDFADKRDITFPDELWQGLQ